MGIEIDESKPFPQSVRDYLNGRGFGYKVIENDRIFGKPAQPPTDPEAVAAGITPGVAEDPVSGNVGETEYAVQGLPGPQAGVPSDAHNQPQESEGETEEGSTDDDSEEGLIDDDIAEKVTEMTIAELKAELDKAEVDYKSNAKHADLAEELAYVLQEKRDAQK